MKLNNANGLQTMLTRTPAGNKVLPKAGVTNFYETFMLYSTLVFQINCSAEIPRLRQYPNRCGEIPAGFRHIGRRLHVMYEALRDFAHQRFHVNPDKYRGCVKPPPVVRNAMRTTVTILTILLLTSVSGRLFACSCIGQRTVQEEVKHSDAVLVGTIVNKDILTLTDSILLQMFPNDTTMKNSSMTKMTIARYGLLVSDIYKGKITADTVTIYTGLGGGDCGIRFKIGEKYIVYGENNTYFGQVNNDFKFPKGKNAFWTYSCLRTMSYYQDEITEIEKYAKRKHIAKDEVIFADPNSPPTFKEGGDIGLKKFIRENLRYPKTGECVSGKVYVGFTVDTLGNVKDIEIKKGITTSTDEEAIRVVKLLTFVPGTRFGQPIEMKMVLPISFTIEYKDDK